VADTTQGYAPPVTDPQVSVAPAELFGDGVPLAAPPVADLVSDGPEAALRIIRTRRSQHVTVSEIPADTLRERISGVRVISASLGPRPEWSLFAAKTLSYAPNFAARRWARDRGADDMLWLTTDGYALEAPTASLIWLAGDTLGTVPAAEAPILPGTTAAHLLARAGEVGLRAVERMITIEELRGADAIWLSSALRGLAFVTELDGVPRRRSRWTSTLLGLLGFPSAADAQ
jgi:4-amino-4-deoxychorismate lyase